MTLEIQVSPICFFFVVFRILKGLIELQKSTLLLINAKPYVSNEITQSVFYYIIGISNISTVEARLNKSIFNRNTNISYIILFNKNKKKEINGDFNRWRVFNKQIIY